MFVDKVDVRRRASKLGYKALHIWEMIKIVVEVALFSVPKRNFRGWGENSYGLRLLLMEGRLNILFTAKKANRLTEA